MFALAVAGWLFMPGMVEAQHHGGGGHGGFHAGGGGFHAGGFHAGGFHPGRATFHGGTAFHTHVGGFNHFGHVGRFDNRRFGFVGLGGFYWPYSYGYGYGYPYSYGSYWPGYGYYSTPSYYSDYSPVYTYPYLPSDSYDSTPGMPYIPDTTTQPYGYNPAPTSDQNRVTLNVRVPTSDAQVWVEGSPTSETGTDRQFVSPPLTTGRSYTYEIRARWFESGREINQTRRVDVHAGESVMVDFTQPG
jgi:uncharacterized protein (TIGR03000 family)